MIATDPNQTEDQRQEQLSGVMPIGQAMAMPGISTPARPVAATQPPAGRAEDRPGEGMDHRGKSERYQRFRCEVRSAAG